MVYSRVLGEVKGTDEKVYRINCGGGPLLDVKSFAIVIDEWITISVLRPLNHGYL